MKHSNIQQVLHVKALAAASLTPENIPNDTLGIVDVKTGKTVLPATFKALPETFRFISKFKGEVYYSLHNINKNQIKKSSVIATEPKEQKNDVWEVELTHTECTRTANLTLYVNANNEHQRISVVEAFPEYIGSVCNCEDKATYNNNLVLKALFVRLQHKAPQFFTVALKEGETEYTTLGDIAKFIEDNKEDATKKLKLVFKGVEQTVGEYSPLTYVNNRGVSLLPSLIINDNIIATTNRTQQLQYERGNGYDLKKLEYDNFNYYTNLNFGHKTPEGHINPNLPYQFSSDEKYHVVNFVYEANKTDSWTKEPTIEVGVTLGTTDKAEVFDKLKVILLPV